MNVIKQPTMILFWHYKIWRQNKCIQKDVKKHLYVFDKFQTTSEYGNNRTTESYKSSTSILPKAAAILKMFVCSVILYQICVQI